MTVRYWFVRHGESTANAGAWLAGHRDAPLTDKGAAQARALAPQLAEIAPGRVISSDLSRAARTADLAWGDRLPAIERCIEARERHLGAWEGAPIEDLRRRGAMNVLLSWDGAPPGGESHLLLARRAIRFLADRDDGTDTLIFAHGGWIRTVVGLADGMAPDAIGRVKVANTELVARDVPRGDWARIAAALA